MIKPQNLLIVRTDRIGDVILTIPLAGVIKKYYPGCRVTFLVREYTAPLTRNAEFIDETIILPETEGRINFSQTLRIVKSKHFDTVIIVHPRFRISLILLLAGINYRIGTGYRWYSFLFNRKVYEHRKYAERHELEYNFNLLGHLNIAENINKSNIIYNISVDPAIELKITRFLLEHIKDPSLPIIIVHPGSSGSSVDLPLEKMREIVKFTAQELNVNIILTGSREEAGLCGHLMGPENVVNFGGMLNLEELKALINRAVLLIANSTGPIHIAAALGKNVIGFYPKVKVCSPERWGPYTDKAVIFQPKLDCGNCSIKQCKELDCMNSIDVSEVLDAIRKVIKGK